MRLLIQFGWSEAISSPVWVLTFPCLIVAGWLSTLKVSNLSFHVSLLSGHRISSVLIAGRLVLSLVPIRPLIVVPSEVVLPCHHLDSFMLVVWDTLESIAEVLVLVLFSAHSKDFFLNRSTS